MPSSTKAPISKASILKEKARSASQTSTTKTLTPQRKHRKLLKDGTSEVWPESIEKIFVQGLRHYWESPWATYSRGRSRWRNQFLVDYLHKAGIDRTKKQVASHIQVLRNMWKGEPEFHLVAGGEELFLETGLLAPVKLECDTGALIPLDFDDKDTLSSLSPSTPGTEFLYECTPEISNHSPVSPFSPGYQPNHCSLKLCDNTSSPAAPSPTYSVSGPTLPHRTFSGTLAISQTSATRPRVSPLVTSSAPCSPTGDAGQRAETDPAPTRNPTCHTPSPYATPKLFAENKLCYIALWAEGMLPFTAPSDTHTLTSSRTLDPIVFRIRLHLSSIDDIQCPPTFHGFHGTVSLALPWQHSAQCVTKVYTNGVCISEEVGTLQLVSHSSSLNGSHNVQAFLPESPLSRSRWLDASEQTCILQHIVVDNVGLAFIIYDLDRKDTTGTPSAHLQAMHKHRPQDGPTPPILPNAAPSYQLVTNYGQGLNTSFIPRLIRRPEPTSLSCALIPNHNLTSFNTSMLF